MAFRKTRYDSKRVAPCIKYSMWHCYRYRGEAGECIGCKLVNKRNWTKKVIVKDGVKMASCSTCGRMFPISEYQMCTKIRYDKDGNSYRLHSIVYRCRECTRKAVMKSQEKKKLNGYVDIARIYNIGSIGSNIDFGSVCFCEDGGYRWVAKAAETKHRRNGQTDGRDLFDGSLHVL